MWGLPGAPPALDTSRGKPLCVDLDAALVTAHSEKGGAAGTYKGSFGYHPGSGVVRRPWGRHRGSAGWAAAPGKAGSNTAADHICLLDAALAGLPDLPDGRQVLVRGDVGYAAKDFLAHAVESGCGFSVSFELSERVKTVVRTLAWHTSVWRPALTADGELREGAAVAEATGMIDLSEYPAGSRLIIRREPLHPGAQQTLDDVDGYRFTALLTDQPGADIAVIEQGHRARARAEERIRNLKDPGMGNLPCADYARNAVWLQLALIAMNLQV